MYLATFWGLVRDPFKIIKNNILFGSQSVGFFFMALAGGLLTFEELKRQAEDIRSEGKERTKFLTEGWRKIQDAAEEKEQLAAEERRLAAEWEAEERRLAAEREAEERRLAAEVEKEHLALTAAERDAERKAKLESEKLELEAKVEIERLRLVGSNGTSSEDHVVSSQAPQEYVGARTKAPVLPAFVDGKDNLDSYLLRFERYATVAGWDRGTWATRLSPLLSCRALNIYSGLSDEAALDYDRLERALLQRYDFTEQGYRERFRGVKPEGQESPSQFIVRIRNYFSKWVDLAGVEKSFEGVSELMVKEQFPKDVSVFLKEKSPENLEELAKLAEQYLTGHNKTLSTKTIGVKQDARESRPVLSGSQKDAFRCFACDGRGHKAADCPSRTPAPRSEPVSRGRRSYCFKCGGMGHDARDCRSAPQRPQPGPRQEWRTANGNPAQTQRVACAMQVPRKKEKVESESGAETLELKSGEKIKVLNGACMEADIKNNLPVLKGKVKGKSLEVLRDTGCSGVIVKKELVDDEEFTGEVGHIMTIDRALKRSPMARMKVDTPFYVGEVEALCLKDPLFDLIIGNVPGAREPSDPNPEWGLEADVVTREKVRENKETKPLEVKEVATKTEANKADLIELKEEGSTSQKFKNLKNAITRNRIEETAMPDRRDIPGEAREEARVGTEGVQGGHSQATAVGEASVNAIGVSADVAREQEEDSIDEEELLELAGFQQKESIHDVCLGVGLSVRQQDEIMRVLGKYEEIFTEVPGKANIIEHKIDLTDDRPIRCKPYSLPYAVREDIREEIKT